MNSDLRRSPSHGTPAPRGETPYTPGRALVTYGSNCGRIEFQSPPGPLTETQTQQKNQKAFDLGSRLGGGPLAPLDLLSEGVRLLGNATDRPKASQGVRNMREHEGTGSIRVD